MIGTDLSPIQPTLIPPNVQFEIADADEEWTFRTRFDLVHTRLLNDTSLSDWSSFYQKAFDVLKPGGWVESQEFSYRRGTDDNSVPEDSAITKWQDLWTEGIEMIGRKGVCNPDLIETQMANAGFVNITRRNFKLPLGPWCKDKTLKQAGLYTLTLADGLHGLSVKIFTQLLGWSVDEMEVLLAQCRKELKRKDIHAYYRMLVSQTVTLTFRVF